MVTAWRTSTATSAASTSAHAPARRALGLHTVLGPRGREIRTFLTGLPPPKDEPERP
ncbi:hypothetical protein BN2537_17073 [Streptomyces venezuelae]|nr:hypothetical protein BN2537_17073 [Streptomyces venezuelae]